MNRCKDCRWWDAGFFPRDEAVAGDCKSPALPFGGQDWQRNSVSSADGYNGIMTGPEFGCVNWEAKEMTINIDYQDGTSTEVLEAINTLADLGAIVRPNDRVLAGAHQVHKWVDATRHAQLVRLITRSDPHELAAGLAS